MENSLASRVKPWFTGSFIFLILGALGAGSFWYLGPFRAPQEETFVEIEHGMSSQAIAATLASQGLIRSPWTFLAARLLHRRAKLQAGEYRFGPLQTPFEIFDKISRGQVYFQIVTIPEGSNKFDIAAIVDGVGIIKADDFLKAAADPAEVRDLDPAAPDLEGYLFPSSYEITHTTSAQQLCRMMTNEFRKQWRALKSDILPGVELHRVVTLASLVEKETGLASERPLVAGVFNNRLRLNMPLQCDPTTVYAALLDNRYRGTIYASDLQSPSAYNTYRHTGLPPGPICNPGLDALRAAISPAKTGYLYFVSDANGHSRFSTTLKEHTANVQEYRKTEHAAGLR